MLDLIVVQKHALIELLLLSFLTLCAFRPTPVLPRHRDLLRRRDRKARLPPNTKVAPKRDLSIPRAVRRSCEGPLRRLDPAADEDDVLRLEVEPADVARELVPTGVVAEDVPCEVAAGVEDLAVRVVLEDEHCPLLV